MAQIGQSRDVMKIPHVSAETVEHHRANNTYLELWANRLPRPKVSVFDQKAFDGDGSVEFIIKVPVLANRLYRLDAFAVFAPGLSDPINTTAIITNPNPSASYGLLLDPPSRLHFGGSFVGRWIQTGMVSISMGYSTTPPEAGTANGYIQLTELEEI